MVSKKCLEENCTLRNMFRFLKSKMGYLIRERGSKGRDAQYSLVCVVTLVKNLPIEFYDFMSLHLAFFSCIWTIILGHIVLSIKHQWVNVIMCHSKVSVYCATLETDTKS